MAKRTKADLGAALGALINPPPDSGRASAEAEERTRSGPDVSVETLPADADAPEQEGPGYARTSTGYRRESGEVVRRLSLFLTERERRELRRQAVNAGAENVTEYVVAALRLHPDQEKPD